MTAVASALQDEPRQNGDVVAFTNRGTAHRAPRAGRDHRFVTWDPVDDDIHEGPYEQSEHEADAN